MMCHYLRHWMLYELQIVCRISRLKANERDNYRQRHISTRIYTKAIVAIVLVGYVPLVGTAITYLILNLLRIANRNRNKKMTQTKPSREVRNIIDGGRWPPNKHSMTVV